MSRILPLPKDTISQLRSSKQITSLQGVAIALLENSLDARATKAEITVDFRRGCCTIEDNGDGIIPDEFDEGGGLGKLHHTSKQELSGVSEWYHGQAGSYLASLGNLSLLTITSQHKDHTVCGKLSWYRGKVIKREITAATERESRFSLYHGTKVTVSDLFGNIPVRVKQRVLAGDSRTGDEKAWDELKHEIAALLLAWPRPCAVRLTDMNKSSRSLTITGYHPTVSAALTTKNLNQLTGKNVTFDLKDVLPVIFQCGLASADSWSSWINVNATSANLSVKGLICLLPAPTRRCQFISIGVHPCSVVSGHNDLYDIVNKTFAQSSFGAIEDVSDGDEVKKTRRKCDRRYKSEGYTKKQLHRKKGVDRHPMFVLQLRMENHGQIHTLAQNAHDADLQSIMTLLEATALQWLTAHHFRPQRRHIRKNEKQQRPSSLSYSPAPSSVTHLSRIDSPVGSCSKRTSPFESVITTKKRRICDISGREVLISSNSHQMPASFLNDLSRIKAGNGLMVDHFQSMRKPTTSPTGHFDSVNSKCKINLPGIETGPLILGKLASHQGDEANALSVASLSSLEHQKERISSDDFGSVDEETMIAAVQQVERINTLNTYVMGGNDISAEDVMTDWKDPITKQTYKISSRTGVVLPNHPKVPEPDFHANASGAAAELSYTASNRPLSLLRRSTTSRPQTSWLTGFLKDWNNPVFKNQDEERIQIAAFDGPRLESSTAAKHSCTDRVLHQLVTEAGISGMTKLSKYQLKQARVIRQVDEKFILCLVPSTNSEASSQNLILVDQHAASERVILEMLLLQLCAPIDATSSASQLKTNLGCQSAVQTVLLERSHKIQISATEAELFRKHAIHFAQWGILYDLQGQAGHVTDSKMGQQGETYEILVRALPTVIAERCTLSPNLLIELLRSEIWSLTSSKSWLVSGSKTDNLECQDQTERHSWVKRLGSCPKGILDMLNSRACRSAIMFNDMLSNQECVELLSNLAECAFPFICAHGRISMVPILQLGSEGGDGLGMLAVSEDMTDGPKENESEANALFAKAFWSWQSRNNPALQI